uniref:Uncharacterized protein n=1 Tax=Heterorhabditis bacteriophora TaxID=37862 RepID=A0A1I7XGR0_HETBA
MKIEHILVRALFTTFQTHKSDRKTPVGIDPRASSYHCLNKILVSEASVDSTLNCLTQIAKGKGDAHYLLT